MTYEYACQKCDQIFDVIKPVKEIDNIEHCPDCGGVGDRMFAPRRVYLSGTAVQNAEYNPALGCVVKNKEHRAEIAKRKGLIEIGNDFKSGDSLQNKFEKDRREKREKSWEDV